MYPILSVTLEFSNGLKAKGVTDKQSGGRLNFSDSWGPKDLAVNCHNVAAPGGATREFILLSNMISTDTYEEIKMRHYSEARDHLIGKKRGHIAIKEVLHAFSEEVKSDAKDQTFVTDEILIKSGAPAEVIVQTAKEQTCDLIVMGTHGHSVIANVLVGSTLKWVIRQSPVPVLVIRLP